MNEDLDVSKSWVLQAGRATEWWLTAEVTSEALRLESQIYGNGDACVCAQKYREV